MDDLQRFKMKLDANNRFSGVYLGKGRSTGHHGKPKEQHGKKDSVETTFAHTFALLLKISAILKENDELSQHFAGEVRNSSNYFYGTEGTADAPGMLKYQLTAPPAGKST